MRQSSDQHPSPCGKPLTYVSENLILYRAHEPPKQGEAHAHDAIQISLPLSGAYRASWQTVAGQRRQRLLSPGALLLCASQQPHTVQVEQDTEVAAFWLPAPFLAHTAEELGSIGRVEIHDTGGVEDALLHHLCLALLAELTQENPTRLYVESITNLLAMHLVRCHSTGRTPTREAGGLAAPALRLVTDYVGVHLDQDISLADLSGVATLSASQFGRLFRQSTGLSPYRYVLAQRVERAKSLLCEGRFSVGEVALRVGFCDQSQFTRQFKKHVGQTPLVYAKSFHR